MEEKNPDNCISLKEKRFVLMKDTMKTRAINHIADNDFYIWNMYKLNSEEKSN